MASSDYLTPTRSQYWRDASPYRAPAFAGSRTNAPAPPAPRASTPVSSYRATSSPYASRGYNAPVTPARDYGSPRTTLRSYAVAPADDYSTPPRRSIGAHDSAATGSGWRPGDLGASSSDPRGRAAAPRTPGYSYVPVQRMDVPASNHAPPRPHLQAAEGSSLGRWTPSGSYASPYRARDDSPPASASRPRAASPIGGGGSSSMTATHFAPPRDSYRVGGVRRSPSMVKDPCTAFLPAAHPNASHRLCLALDLDETLVYARNGPVHVRPFVKELLRELHDMDVEVIVWTAGERDYAQSVIKLLDPHGTIQHCVYRHSKWWNGKPGYSKNLRSLGRNLSRTLLVDNTPDCLRDHPDNGLLVSDFEGPRSASYDQCLRDLVHVAAEIVARPNESVPRIMADSRYVAKRTVPMDAGGNITTWTLAHDRVLEEVSYQSARYNRDSPQRTRGGW